MNAQKEKHYRSQISLQLIYTFKRWQMLSTVRKLVEPQKEKKHCCKTLQATCESFIQENEILLRYSKEQGLPPHQARE